MEARVKMVASSHAVTTMYTHSHVANVATQLEAGNITEKQQRAGRVF